MLVVASASDCHLNTMKTFIHIGQSEEKKTYVQNKNGSARSSTVNGAKDMDAIGTMITEMRLFC